MGDLSTAFGTGGVGGTGGAVAPDCEVGVSVGPAAASEVVAACEAAWTAIQRHHPGVPDSVIVLGTGVERGRLVKLGHWWDGRWIADGDLRGEVLLAGEALHLSPEAVLEVLLHEAAHGLNAARGVKDSSRGGRYHNARFKVTAEELGLAVASVEPYGWAQTSIGPAARGRYEVEIGRLGEAMRIARRLSAGVRLGEGDERGENAGAGGERQIGTAGDSGSRSGPARCGCGRRMRMAPSVLARGPVLCGLCGQDFTVGREAAGVGRPRAALPVAEPVDGTETVLRRGDGRGDEPAVAAAGGTLAELVRSGDLSATQREGLEELLRLGARPDGALLLAEAGAWYATRRAGDEKPLLGRTDAEVEAASHAARAMLKLDGTLRGPALAVGGHELMAGDDVMVGASAGPLVDLDGRELPPAGVLGRVEEVDLERGRLVVDFPIAGRHVVSCRSAAAGALAHGYAEHVASVGAPLVDLRTLPAAPQPEVEPLGAAIELEP